MRVRAVCAVAGVALASLACSPQLGAQSSQMSVTYTAVLSGSPTSTDFNLGRVIAGFADVAVTRCGRGTCLARMQLTAASTGSTDLRYVISATAPTLASCANAPAVGTFIDLITVVSGSTATARVYFCYNLSWTASPPASYAPAMSFLLRNGA
jgi:hypothetical protein